MRPAGFESALLIVDVQEDFCPPNGALAVPDGRSILPAVNRLLDLPFTERIASVDWHPRNHVSFAANYDAVTPPPPPHVQLWPVHCVQYTPGAALVPGLRQSRLTGVVKKGQDARFEAYSAFDPLSSLSLSSSSSSSLADMLHGAGVTHVFVVGLAMDYCVKFTALDAVAAGFNTVVVREGTRAVDAARWGEVQAELEAAGVAFVSVDGPEVKRVADQRADAL